MQVEPAGRTEQQTEALAGEAYRWLLDDERGRYIARRVLQWAGIEDTGPVSDVTAMAVATGRRMVGNLFRAQLRKHHPEGCVRFEAQWIEELNREALRAAAKAEAEKAEQRLHEEEPQ